MAIIAIPIGEVLIEGAIALWGIITANAVPIAAGVATGVVLNEVTKDKAAPTTGTTTIVGTGKMNCGDNGNYDDMLKKDGDGKLDRDHVPSKAALQEAARDLIREMRLDPTNPKLAQLFGDKGLISKQGQTIAIPKKDHQQHSRTYGRQNNPDKVKGDSENLQEAANKDTKEIEEGDGKDMDDECFGKYKKAAEKIRKKTHAEYLKDLTDLINKAIK
jgi:hypothetical protein